MQSNLNAKIEKKKIKILQQNISNSNQTKLKVQGEYGM